jgi:hypothetical protein
MSILKSLIPRTFRECVSVYRAYLSNVQENARLWNEQRHELQSYHLRNLCVVPTRRELLGNLPVNGVIAEVGVAAGGFSKQILEICNPRKLYLIDLWNDVSEHDYSEQAYNIVQQQMTVPIANDQVEILRGWSWEMIERLPENSLDWVYLDAAHDYASVVRDLDACRTRIKPGGFIAGHDYTIWSNNGISRFGVVEAVNGFCLKHGWEMCFLTHESHRHCSYAIRKIDDPGNLQMLRTGS